MTSIIFFKQSQDFCVTAHAAQKMKSSIKDFFSKCENCGFGHIYWRNP